VRYAREWEEAIIASCFAELDARSAPRPYFVPDPVLGPPHGGYVVDERWRPPVYSAKDLCERYPMRFAEVKLRTALKRMAHEGKLRRTKRSLWGRRHTWMYGTPMKGESCQRMT
jgi:hypothetical protein